MPADELGPWATFRTSVERIVVNVLLGIGWIRRLLARSRRDPVEGQTLAEDVAAMLGLDDIGDRSDLRRLSLATARARVAESVHIVDAPAPPGVTHEDREVPSAAGPIRVRVYTPDGSEGASPAVVYIHGGGWVTGSVATHDGFCRRIAHGARVRVVSVEYRLAPEHRFPAALDDSLAATRWVLAHAEELGIDPSRVAVAGDSAGGNLSAVVARRTRGDARRPALQVLLYPALDATCSLPSHQTFGERYFLTREMCAWYYGHYLGDGDPRAADASPLLAPEVSEVPALIYTAGFDPLRDEGRAYAERLRSAGTPVTYHELADTVHGFALMTGASATARDATNGVIAEMKRLLGA
jgi:acetyl esterase